MTPYWITFTEGAHGCCEGQSAYDAMLIAEKITGRQVALRKGEADPGRLNGRPQYAAIHKYQVDPLPYPAAPIIWQFDHPISGRCPAFCHAPQTCAGKTACPRSYACDN